MLVPIDLAWLGGGERTPEEAVACRVAMLIVALLKVDLSIGMAPVAIACDALAVKTLTNIAGSMFAAADCAGAAAESSLEIMSPTMDIAVT